MASMAEYHTETCGLVHHVYRTRRGRKKMVGLVRKNYDGDCRAGWFLVKPRPGFIAVFPDHEPVAVSGPAEGLVMAARIHGN